MKKLGMYVYYHYESGSRTITPKTSVVEILGVEGKHVKIRLQEDVENKKAGDIILIDPSNITEIQ